MSPPRKPAAPGRDAPRRSGGTSVTAVTPRGNGRSATDGGSGKALSGRTMQLPVVRMSIPESALNVAFWGALIGSAALGVVDPPLAALIGAGVLVARHGRRA